MDVEKMVHRCRLQVAGEDYEVLVFLRADGRHIAKTFFTAADVIINDGTSLDEALQKHQRLLPLAVDSRRLTRDYHPGRPQTDN